MEEQAASGFLVRQRAFSGTLQELLTALRSGRLPPSDLDLLGLVRDWLAYFEQLSVRDLDAASEALPRVAQVLELKLRLLLPRQPRLDEEELLEEVAEAVEALLDMDNAIDYLRLRREDRRLLLPARVGPPALERERRPQPVPAGRLAELAARLRSANYFELAREGFGFRQATRQLLDLLKVRNRFSFSELREGQEWSRVTVMFVALLELVRQERVKVVQAESFGDLLVRRSKKGVPGDPDTPVGG